MSIASEITRIDNAKASLKASLEAKGATVSDDAKIDAYPSILDDIPVALLQDKEVNVSGGTTLIEPDQGYTGLHSVSVNVVEHVDLKAAYLYDYDGTLLYSYTYEELQALASLPEIPDHSSIGFDKTSEYSGWNWTLAQLKSLPEGNSVNVVACYDTTDKNTHLFVTIDADTLTRFYAFCYCHVDWGDGNSEDINNNSGAIHTYASIGDYEIIISKNTGISSIYKPYVGTGMYTPIRRSNASTGDETNSVLTKVNIGSSYNTSLSQYSFSNSICLQYFTAPNIITSFGRDSFSKTLIECTVIPNSVTSIGHNCYYSCKKLKIISIPHSVTSIGNAVFSGCNSIVNVWVPNCTLGNEVFNSCCKLENVFLSSGITSLGNNFFASCFNLKSINIPDSVTSIGGAAFKSCTSLKSIIIPDNVTSIGSDTFYNCYNLKSVTIPSGVTSIGMNAFQNCYVLQSITLPDDITSIGQAAFNSCYSLKSISLPSSLLTISYGAFQYCNSLESITLPDTITSIGGTTFSSCNSLKSINIPSELDVFESNLFQYCTSIKYFTIPSHVTEMKGYVFYGMYECVFTMESSVPPVISNSTFSAHTLLKIRVPKGSLSTYQSATNWSALASYMEELPE